MTDSISARLTGGISQAFSTMLRSEASRTVGRYTSNLTSDIKGGIVGGILAAVVGFFTLPFYIPTILPMAAGAYAGFQANRAYRHVQEHGANATAAQVMQVARNHMNHIGQAVVKAVESGYDYITRGNVPIVDYDDPDQFIPSAQEQLTSTTEDEYEYRTGELLKNADMSSTIDRILYPPKPPLTENEEAERRKIEERNRQQALANWMSPITPTQSRVVQEDDEVFGPVTVIQYFENGRWVNS